MVASGVRRAGFRNHVLGFGGERAIVAVGHATGIQAHHLASITDDINVLAFDCGRGGYACLRPIHEAIFLALWHEQLPEKAAGLFIETHQDTAISLAFWITGISVIGSDINAATRDDGR